MNKSRAEDLFCADEIFGFSLRVTGTVSAVFQRTRRVATALSPCTRHRGFDDRARFKNHALLPVELFLS